MSKPLLLSGRRARTTRRLVALVVAPLVALATGGWWWGGDTNSNPPSQSGTRVQVYVGEVGYGDTSTCNEAYFNNGSAQDVVNNNGSDSNVYAYWYLSGPASEGLYGNAAYSLGVRQAIDLYGCWASKGNSDGLTLFGDVESNSTWWLNATYGSANWQANVNVVSGFAAEMKALAGTLGGIYTSLSFLDEYMTGQNWPSQYFVWWGVSGCPQSGGQPGTLQSLTWYETAMTGWHNANESGSCLGGAQGVSMWQYWTTSTQDFDLTPQEGPPYECTYNYQDHEVCGGYFIPGWGDGTI